MQCGQYPWCVGIVRRILEETCPCRGVRSVDIALLLELARAKSMLEYLVLYSRLGMRKPIVPVNLGALALGVARLYKSVTLFIDADYEDECRLDVSGELAKRLREALGQHAVALRGEDVVVSGATLECQQGSCSLAIALKYGQWKVREVTVERGMEDILYDISMEFAKLLQRGCTCIAELRASDDNGRNLYLCVANERDEYGVTCLERDENPRLTTGDCIIAYVHGTIHIDRIVHDWLSPFQYYTQRCTNINVHFMNDGSTLLETEDGEIVACTMP